MEYEYRREKTNKLFLKCAKTKHFYYVLGLSVAHSHSLSLTDTTMCDKVVKTAATFFYEEYQMNNKRHTAVKVKNNCRRPIDLNLYNKYIANESEYFPWVRKTNIAFTILDALLWYFVPWQFVCVSFFQFVCCFIRWLIAYANQNQSLLCEAKWS